MRLLVLGHSDSAGEALPPGTQPWPGRVAERLQEIGGEPVHLVHVKFTAFGPRAVDYATRKITEANPDIVIMSLSAYPCAVTSVSLSVRRRFGERSERWYKALERAFDRRTFERPGVGRASNTVARRLTRRMLGATALATVDETFAIYDAILRFLAQMEGVGVVALAETNFSALLQHYDPPLLGAVMALKSRLRPVVEQHRFTWLDIEPLAVATGDRESLFHPDGVHSSPRSHDYFEEWVPAAMVAAGLVEASPRR